MEIYQIPVSDNGESEHVLIYRPLLGLAFVGNRAMAHLVSSQMSSRSDPEQGTTDEATEFLSQIGFLDEDPPAPALPSIDFHPTLAVLLMTNQCQLRCIYCYAASGESAPQNLPKKTAFRAIDLVCQNAQAQGLAKFEVSFHGGGEPTYPWQLVKACVEYARRMPIKASLTVTSNGMWSAAQCDYILDHFDGVSLSTDGAPATQDYQRPTANGRKSSPRVMSNIAEIERRGVPYGIRMTATPPWKSLPRDIEYICENTRCPSIQVEPAFNKSRGGHGESSEDLARAFVDAFLEAHDVARNANRHLYYSGSRLGVVATSFCSAPFGALIVNVDSDLVACYEIASNAHTLAAMSKMGVLIDGEIVVDQNRERLYELMKERRSSCKECFAYWTCAGDCFVRAFDPITGDHLLHGVRCLMNRSILKNLLLRGIADGDGVWRSQNRRLIPVGNNSGVESR